MPEKNGETKEELNELLQGLRVLLPGVQVLFAFLLTAAFSSGFPKANGTQRAAFFVSLTSVAVSAVLLMAPSVHQRIMYQVKDHKLKIRQATKYALAGTLFMGVAILAGLFMVLDFQFRHSTAVATTAIIATGLVSAWYLHPLIRRMKDR